MTGKPATPPGTGYRCAYCGATGLRWGRGKLGRRLYEPDQSPHYCAQRERAEPSGTGWDRFSGRGGT